MSSAEQIVAKQRLLAKLQELSWQFRRDGIAIDRAPDELDEVQQASEQELALAAIERDVALANQVRLALQRLERGEYGKCIRCNKRIGSRRLKAVPWASMCLTCQGDVEAEQQRTVPMARPPAPELSPRMNGRYAGSEQTGVKGLTP